MDALGGSAALGAQDGPLRSVDPPPVHGAVLDASGVIVAANDRWAAAARDARSTVGALGSVGSRYHDACDARARERPEMRRQLLRLSSGVRAVLGGEGETAFGYAVEDRTYSARVIPVRGAGDDLTLVALADTTDHPGGGAALEMRARLDTLVDALGVAVLMQDLEGRPLAWNPGAERILGLTGDQLSGSDPIDPRWTLLHKDGLPLPPEERPSRVALRTGRPCRDAIVGVRHPDERVTWAAVSAVPLTHEGEERPYAVAISLADATAAHAEHDGRDRYRSLVEHSPDFVTIVDERGNVTYESPSVEAVLGYPPGELVGTSRIARVHPDDVAGALSTVTSLIGRPGDSVSCEYRIMDSDGRWRVLESVATNRLDDPAVRGISLTSRDVTERRQSETELRAATSRLENLVQSLQAGVLVEDEERRVAVVNADLCEMFGIEGGPEALVGGDCREAARGAAAALADPDRFVDRIEELIADSRPVSGEEVVFADGRTFERDYIPLSFGRRERAHLWLYRDISIRKAGEREAARLRDEAIRTSRLKSEFLATLSHEIRTPMNGVIGTVELLLDTALEAHQRDLVELVRDAGYGLLSIVNDALDLSRIEAEQLGPKEAELDLVGVAEGVADVMLTAARRKGLVVTVFVDPRIPGRLHGDAQWLRQVLVNLAGNAVKFTDRGDVRIRVELEAQTAGSSTIRFSVSDTGIGIPQSARERLFDPFVQLEPGSSGRQGGTGLGLSICRRLVRLMGGEIEVDSEPGRGSTFSFAIALPRCGEAAAPPPPERAMGELRVLIVEPREALAGIVNDYLGAWGIESHGAASAQEARERAATAARAGRPYGVAIVGIGQPEAAAEVASELRATPGCEAMALVLLTDVGARASVPEGLFARELTRPLKRAQLYETVVGAPRAPALERGDAASAPGPKPPAAAALPAGMRVLVAEDNEVNSELLVRQLAKLGAEAEAVASGREAVEAVAARHYDAVLMDSHMPEVDGLQAARAIRALSGKRGDTPIVAVTGSATPSERGACLAAGMDDLLAKPISSSALAMALARVVPRSAAHVTPGPAIDAASIDRLLADIGDRDELRRIAGIYLAQLDPGTRAVAVAASGGDDDALRRSAHRLGSASATFGATLVAELCHRLEALGAAGRADAAAELSGSLEHESERAQAELRRLLELD